jgi:hypothetical protein
MHQVNAQAWHPSRGTHVASRNDAAGAKHSMRAEPEQIVGGWLQVLCRLLTVWEPILFAIAAAGASNAVSVRGLPVVLMLAARLMTVALCVAAGRALSGARSSGPALAKAAVSLSAAVQVLAYVTPYFPSNRPPGQTPIYVVATLAYYGAWFAYLMRSKRVAAILN